jgi:hypothetical protein
MSNFQHQELAEGRWFTFSLAEQMGNIGSEVGRAINWKNKGNVDQMNRALDRGLELFDLTLADKRYKYPQLKEISRAREVVCDYFFGNNEFKSDDRFLSNYFTQFAFAARAHL